MLVDFSLKVVHTEKKKTRLFKKKLKKKNKTKLSEQRKPFSKQNHAELKKAKVFFSSFLGGFHARHCPPEKTTKKLRSWSVERKNYVLSNKGRVQFRLNHGGKSNPLHKSIRILIFAYFSLRWQVESVSFCLHYEERDFQIGKVRIHSCTSWSSFFSFSVIRNDSKKIRIIISRIGKTHQASRKLTNQTILNLYLFGLSRHRRQLKFHVESSQRFHCCSDSGNPRHWKMERFKANGQHVFCLWFVIFLAAIWYCSHFLKGSLFSEESPFTCNCQVEMSGRFG